MCLMIEKHVEPSIAEEDITVYKIVETTGTGRSFRIRSGFYDINFIYKLGQKYETVIEKTWDSTHFDSEEIGAYSHFTKLNIKYIGPGFHSMGSVNRAPSCFYIKGIIKYRMMECTIPKGALYYHNLSDLYVSNRLIPVKLLRKR
jgi:hypothetical protein